MSGACIIIWENGNMVMPVENLGEDLKVDNLMKDMISRNCFDFNNSPAAGDNSQIREEYVYKMIKGKQREDLYDYIPFIFRKGKWKEDV